MNLRAGKREPKEGKDEMNPGRKDFARCHQRKLFPTEKKGNKDP